MIAGTDCSSERRSEVTDIVRLATEGLKQMVDPQSRLFCHTLKQTPSGMEREGISHRYTMMTLLGLHRLEAAGQASPVEIRPMLDVLLRDTRWINGTGDLGLLLWTCAEIAPDRLPEVYVRVHPYGALRRFADTHQGHTMEVAWYLAGISHCLLATPSDISDLAQEAATSFQLLKRNCGAGGIFGHLTKTASLAGRLRGRLGSFADQVYPIYALSHYARACGNDEAKHMALRTARTICRHQGPLGQWWWHYDSSTGRVVGRYAVYSVHQHAMAPMALFALEEATGEDFSKPVYAGLNWVKGGNELNVDMRDQNQPVIWRCFYQSKVRTYSNEMLGLAGLPGTPAGLKVKHECRPYELGWLLYAWAGRTGRVA